MPTAGEILTLSPGNEKFHYPPSVKNFSTILELQNQLTQFPDTVAKAIIGVTILESSIYTSAKHVYIATD